MATGLPRLRSGLVVRPLHAGDVRRVVELHLAEFPGFFLTRLGAGVLVPYYRTVADQAHLGFVAFDSGGVAGFVAGYVRGEGFYRRLVVRRGIHLAWAVLPTVVRSPMIGWAIARKLAARDSADVADRRVAWLSSIAVSRTARRKGVGRALADAFVRDAAALGLAEVGLETDAAGNDGVSRFYKDLGFRMTRAFADVDGRPMQEYRLDCRSVSSHA